ncbi:hypothetical protein [Haloplanus halobius]|uniref:hypothetical protein n=1 Tax=Haloplanus halobius TaxID=2934938 RepID=UPI00200D4C52|nr:hypothetical protein [Haloplanus sp. XH21]
MIGPVGVAELSLPAAIGVTLIEGIRRRDGAIVVNAVAALLAALTPVLLGSVLMVDRTAGSWSILSLWLGVAGFLHCLGMLGWYESVWWWDHVTHTTSAALVAAFLYAGFVASSDASALAQTLTAGGATVAVTVGAGVLWELVELLARDLGERFGVDPVLVHYGWRDTAFDLGFDVVGAVGIVLLDVRLFVPIADRFPAATGALLRWSAGTVFVGVALLAVVVYRDR